MVMEHPLKIVVKVALKDKVYRIDIGVSRGVMNGRTEVLEIIHNSHDADDNVHTLTMCSVRMPVIDHHIVAIYSQIKHFFALLFLILSTTLCMVISYSVCHSCTSLKFCTSMKKLRILFHRLAT